MPFSNAEQISPIMAEITRLNPSAILDVGCGLGLYGMLCRIHLDLYYDGAFYKKLEGLSPWNTRIEGIEGCKTYLPFIPSWAYDRIHAGNALDILPTLADKQYDLVLILAMIEHLSLEQGMELIAQLRRVSQAIILSVPKNWQEQQIEGYPLETHRSHWTEQNLRDAGFTRFLPHWGAWLAVYNIPPGQPAFEQPASSELLQAGQPCTDLSDIHQELTRLEQMTAQLQQDMATTLHHQQILFDRLSISSRLRSLRQRLRRCLPW